MAKRNSFPLAMTEMGEPSEMSPIKEVTYEEKVSPIVEVTQPLHSKEPLEIRNPSTETLF